MARARSAGKAKSIGDQLRAGVEGIVKATVLRIDANLRAPPEQGGTPVDTGFARASWAPSAGEPTDDRRSGMASLLAYKLEDGPAYVSNGAAYVPRLNAGSSTQAPAMFIEACIDRALAEMQQDRGGAGAANLASAYSPFGDDE